MLPKVRQLHSLATCLCAPIESADRRKSHFQSSNNINWCPFFFALAIPTCAGEVQNQFLQSQWLTKWLHVIANCRRNNNRWRKTKNIGEVTQNERIVWITKMTFDQKFQMPSTQKSCGEWLIWPNDWQQNSEFNRRKCRHCYHIRKKQISRLRFPKLKSN